MRAASNPAARMLESRNPVVRFIPSRRGASSIIRTLKKLVTLGVAGLLFVPPLLMHLGGAAPPATYVGGIGPGDRAVLYGDTRAEAVAWFWTDYDPTAHPRVSEAIAAEKPAFVIHTGDLVFDGAAADDWAGFDQIAAPLRPFPLYPALGNHDYRGRDDLALQHYFARFPHLQGQKWYALRFKHTLFLIVDSNVKDLREYEIAAQNAWLDGEIRKAADDAGVRFIALVCHHPPITHGPHGSSEFVRNDFVRRARTTPKFRIVFAGHVHSIERFLEDGIHYVNSGGGGAPIVEVKGDDLFAPGRTRRGQSYCVMTFTDAGLDVVIREYLNGAWSDADRVELR
jgi:predicted phosphodiesterase